MSKLTSALAALMLSFASFVAQATGDTKAADLLAQARAALGGEKQLAKVQGLSCAGTLQRLAGDRQIGGELTLDLQLPDKMLRTESISPMGDSALVVSDQGVNGDILLRHTKTLNTPPGMIIRMPPPPAAGSDAETQALRNSRAEMARVTFALLLSAPASMALDFSYGGEAEAADGRADVITVKGPSSFLAQMFLDKTTHRPLMLSYRGIAPQMRVQTVRGPAPAGAQPHPPGGEAATGAAEAPPLVDISMFLDDYQAVDGVMLPHHITRSIDGKTNEEWTFTSIKVNPAFKADTFSVK
ncbi:MAG TPA: hypothetical protein VGJ29_12610 [Vicinamibacterales bacterium]